jgi:negative regulator of genetic competence, sporulation and motility
MNYIKINEGKLKIILEAKDLEDWDIRIDELDYANPCARAIFEEFLAYAKAHLGFDSSGHNVLIHLYPSRDGGCEIFISRLEPKTTDPEKQHSPSAYSFSQLSDLLGACRRLKELGFSGQSSAYFEEDGKWFLLLSDAAEDLGGICEYGMREDPEALLLYVCEYTRSVCEGDAVQRLGAI